MKRRSQPKQRKSKNTYGRKLASRNMMYGPTKHAHTHNKPSKYMANYQHGAAK